MGHLAQSIDVRASRVEADVPRLIERAIIDVLALIKAEMREQRGMINTHRVALNSLTLRVEACEQGKGDSDVVTALNADVIGLRKEVDEQKSIGLSMLFATFEIPDVPSTDVPVSSEVPSTTTIGDVVIDAVKAESEAETDEEELGVHDAAVYRDLEDL
ncbi:hypothetical protein MTR67_022742 [Solanum verrucosum]|uniref:Polyprotein protein n=1 Tax=Solanum verrucosum TaxID=315347 RepID=A0AAF0QVF4_SOLVR|nr:hypothetical protein MTR67_022742 [Solanum verrucosum]